MKRDGFQLSVITILFLVTPADQSSATTALERVIAMYESSGLAALNLAENVAGWSIANRFHPSSIGIDGSISSVVLGLRDNSAVQFDALGFVTPSVQAGMYDATSIGAVNTGSIGQKLDVLPLSAQAAFGLYAAVQEAQTATARAVSAAEETMGASSRKQHIALNAAVNSMAISAHIETVTHQVNHTVERLRTTAIGTVNSGTIETSVNSVVTGIVGRSGVVEGVP